MATNDENGAVARYTLVAGHTDMLIAGLLGKLRSKARRKIAKEFAGTIVEIAE
jgi:hypothetical protein